MAVIIWTVVMITLVVLLGEAAKAPFELLFGRSWIALIVAIVFIVYLLRVFVLLTTRIGRAKLWRNVQRIWQWEFWPMWLFYIPVAAWIVWLAVRYRSATVWTLANPGIPCKMQ